MTWGGIYLWTCQLCLGFSFEKCLLGCTVFDVYLSNPGREFPETWGRTINSWGPKQGLELQLSYFLVVEKSDNWGIEFGVCLTGHFEDTTVPSHYKNKTHKVESLIDWQLGQLKLLSWIMRIYLFSSMRPRKLMRIPFSLISRMHGTCKKEMN